MRRQTRILLAAALYLGVAACGRGAEPEPPFPAAVRMYSNNNSGIRDSLRLVLHDEAEFHRVWEQATSREPEPSPPPAIDFSQQMVVVAAAGRLTSDDQIRVDSARIAQEIDADGRDEDTLNVFVSLLLACRRFDIEGFPLEIVRLRRFDGPIRFRDQRREADCQSASSAPGR